ncbi:hypothetical protein DL93DRAFT_2165335 [Clavulina sp. PMI_390]|nr:hypothetical protein DL93DRAFT_2165335 [Clavulina sp. PMI_390]
MQPKTPLADGSGMKYGTLPSGLLWQSSGELYSGGCTPVNQSISECYELKLSGSVDEHLDPKHLHSPRQRVEFRSPGEVGDGTSWIYTWNSFYPSANLNSTNTFFHFMQIFSQADSGPVYYFDLLRNRDAVVKNWLTNTTIAKVPIEKVMDLTLHHRVEVTYGPQGRLDYTVSQKSNGTTILHVEEAGYMGTGGCYLKFGMYRRVWEGMGPAL